MCCLDVSFTTNPDDSEENNVDTATAGENSHCGYYNVIQDYVEVGDEDYETISEN